MASSYAGETAKAYDASTALTNPAGMVRLDQSELDGSLNGIFPTVNFSGTNMLDGVPVAGSTAGNDAQSGASPAVFGVWNFSPDLKCGFSITGPFGQRITYANDFIGRYQGLVSRISDVTVSLSAAYRVDDHFSIGAGPVLKSMAGTGGAGRCRPEHPSDLPKVGRHLGDPKICPMGVSIVIPPAGPDKTGYRPLTA